MSAMNPDDIDHNDPKSVFGYLGGPIPEYVAPGEARRQAQGTSRSVLDSWRELRAILERHEATIQNRWLKKGRQQKLKVLLEAWPDMPEHHRPDFYAFRTESSEQRERATRYRGSYVWPYINQQDLSKPRVLLLFLNDRKTHPSAFAASDGDAISLGKVTKAIVPYFLNQHTFILNGVSDSSKYGRLLSWDDHPDAFEWMASRLQFLPGEGLLILEAQQKVMKFLVKCCKLILHDIPETTLTTDAYPRQPEPTLKSERDFLGFDSLSVMRIEAPYRAPANLSFARMETLLEATIAAKEDHIWALREDPGYFRDQIVRTSEHRKEQIEDYLGGRHPVFQSHREHRFWYHVISDVVSEAYLPLAAYYELLQQVRQLKTLHLKYATQIKPDRKLPDEYCNALLKFRHYLLQATKGPLGMLNSYVAASPPLRRFFVRKPPNIQTRH